MVRFCHDPQKVCWGLAGAFPFWWSRMWWSRMCHAALSGKAHRLGKTQITLKKASSKDNSVRHIRETGRILFHSFFKPRKRGFKMCLCVPYFYLLMCALLFGVWCARARCAVSAWRLRLAWASPMSNERPRACGSPQVQFTEGGRRIGWAKSHWSSWTSEFWESVIQKLNVQANIWDLDGFSILF